LQVIQEQDRTMLGKVCALLPIFLGGFIGKEIARPDLTVRMRIRAPHDFSLIFEHLNPPIFLAEFLGLFSPYFNYASNRFERHFGELKIMPWKKTDSSTISRSALAAKQAITRWSKNSVRKNGSIVIPEYKGRCVLRVLCAAGTVIPRTEVTLWIVGWPSH